MHTLRQRSHIAILTALVFAGSVKSVSAQNDEALIPFIAYEIGTPHSIQREPGVINKDVFQTDGFGFSVNHTVLLGTELQFPHAFSERFGISLLGSIAQSDGYFRSDTYAGSTPAVHASSGLRLNTENEFTVHAIETQGRIALLGSWTPFRNGLVAIGPWLGYRFSSSVTQTEKILAPDAAVFAEGSGRERTVAAGTGITSFNWRFGLAGRIGYRIPLSEVFALSPFLAGQFDYESLVDKGLGFRAFSGGGGIGFSIDLFSPDSRPDDLAFREDPAPLPEFALTADIDLYSAATDTPNPKALTVTTERIRHTRFVPLLSFIPIDTLRPSAARIPSPEAASTFEEKNLIDQDFSAVQRVRLFITGQRLQAHPATTLSLIPITTDEEDTEERAFADILRQSILDCWGIEPDRVRIGETETGTASGVRLSSSAATVLGPLVQAWQEERFVPPQVRMRKNIVADAGVKHWEVTLSRGETVISRMTEENERGELALLPLDDTAQVLPLRAVLTVIDYTDDTVLAEDDLSFDLSSGTVVEEEIYSWILLDPYDDPASARTNSAFLQLITETFYNGDRILMEALGGAPSEESLWSKEEVALEILRALNEKGVAPEETIVREGSPKAAHPDSPYRIVVTIQRTSPVITEP